METLQAGRKIGCYQLIRILGEGGMGEVWLAHDEPADRSVALKFIKPHLLTNAGMRLRFANEARTLGKLEQDRIVTLYTVLEEGEHLAFVLRFIEGHSLADRIATSFPLPMSFILSLSRDILPALGEAHQRGIIHRDIKPQNILIDRKERSFLSDFGIAITDSLERATIGSFAIGTPHYMSPEQIQTPQDITIAKGGERTDIYSFGIVLYEMLTGQVPFGQDAGSDATFTIQQAHCSQAPARPRAINGNISPAMEEVVLHCLEKDPADRPQTCALLLEEIEAAVAAGAAGVAAPMPRPDRSTVIENAAAPVARPRTSAGRTPTLPSPVAPISPAPAKQSKPRPKMLVPVVGMIVAISLGLGYYALRGEPKPALAPVGKSTSPNGNNTPGNNTDDHNNAGNSGTSGAGAGAGTKTKKDETVPTIVTTPVHSPPTQMPITHIESADPTPGKITSLLSQAAANRAEGLYCEAQVKAQEAIALEVAGGKRASPASTVALNQYKKECEESKR